MKIAYITTFPSREDGINTFTKNLIKAIQGPARLNDVVVVAIDTYDTGPFISVNQDESG